ncbi:MAG: mechanosensitive ion channel [Chloroflexi bacterium]|nr:mechanosensitive ion channel [Chloroflexota bacterium]
MWEWFTVNGVWILIASAMVLTTLLFARERIQASLEKAAEKAPRWIKPSASLAFWIIAGFILIVVATAVIAIILSREGVSAIITPQTIQQWLLEHGTINIITIVVSYLLYRILKIAIPEVVVRSVKIRGKGRRAREELAKRSDTLGSIITGTAGAIIGIMASFMILSDIGVNIAPLLAGAGIAGLAIGFGAQSLIKDLLSGLFILLEDQYNKGDVVKVAGISGIVEEVNMRRTVLRDLDGIVHSIPNGEVTTASNYTKDWSRVNLDIPVAYGEDLDHVIAVLNRVGSELAEDEYFGPKILKAPQVLRVNNFGASGIDIRILGDTKPLMQWEVTGELRKRIKKAFDEEGIEIPWPHVKLYFGKDQAPPVICQNCSRPNNAGNKFCASCGAKIEP